MNHNIINYPTIPTEIVVHLGSPTEAAKDISIPFIDYIKNVASNEIYPTWPDSAIEANILAQISFALNRIYNEWYPSKGYSYDITSLPEYDQTFIIFIVKAKFNHLMLYIVMVEIQNVMVYHNGEA